MSAKSWNVCYQYNRLIWHLERNTLITPIQTGFHKVAVLQTNWYAWNHFVREVFVRTQHVIAIFSDPEKAYDMTMEVWHLERLGLRGQLSLLLDGSARQEVSCDNLRKLLQTLRTGNGRAASVLSVTLFLLFVN